MDTTLRFGAGRLPDRSLVFTFDDGPGATDGPGPGPKTVELAQYLAGDRIEATCECGVDGPIPFRPPWGEWDARIEAAVRADEGILEGHCANYGWDLDGMDWQYWWDQGSPQECADSYVKTALEHGSGVVLMHDSTADPGTPGEQMRAGNLAVEAVKLLVPRLRAEGFSFVPLADLD